MRRRDFIQLGLGGSAAALLVGPGRLAAQTTGTVRRIGVLIARPEGDDEGIKQAAALERGLAGLGWVRGRNLQLDIRWLTSDAAKRQAFVNELVELKPDVLVVNSSGYLALARKATTTIPIVFVAIADPVTQGFVQSLARPGGMLTGFGAEEPSLGAKWVELLKELSPGVKSIAVMFNPDTAPFPRMFLPAIQAVQSVAGSELTEMPVRSEAEMQRAIDESGQKDNSGLIILPDSFMASRAEKIANAVAARRLPTVYSTAVFPRAGGLASLGIDRVDIFLRTAAYVDRVLKGDKPSDLPVQMPSKFELVVNVKAATSLGIAVPSTLLARADEVIE